MDEKERLKMENEGLRKAMAGKDERISKLLQMLGTISNENAKAMDLLRENNISLHNELAALEKLMYADPVKAACRGCKLG